MSRAHGHYFAPMNPEDKRPISRTTVRRVAATFRPYRPQVTVVAIAIVITSVLGVFNPLLIKRVFDQALFGNPAGNCAGQSCPNLPKLYLYVGLMIAIPIVSGVIGLGQTYLANVIGLKIMQDLRNSLYRHLQFMSLRFFTGTRTGEIQSRLSNDVGGVQSVVTDTASSILSNVVIIASTVVAMLILSWQLTALSLFIVPLFMWLTVKVGRARREIAMHTQQSMADLTSVTEETLSVSGILLSKSFGRQRHEIGRFTEENERLTRLQVRQTIVGRSFFAVVQIFFSITPALVYLVAGWVNRGTGVNPALTSGTLVAFTTLQARLYFPVGSMLQVTSDVQTSFALFDRIFEYLDLPHEITDAPNARTLAPQETAGHVRLDDVWFRYEEPDGSGSGGNSGDDTAADPVPHDAATSAAAEDEHRAWTLQGVDIDIEPGKLAALVGPSGAGKTTITYLVPRLYDPQRGRVSIDDVDVRDVKLESLGDLVGVVTQETYLFHTTIRRNLLYGRPAATDEELEAAAKAAFIHDRIVELPDGYDTVVGERGYKMSGGEKQRLAIARVILKDPKILILDEATSSLDSTSERLVQEALMPLMHDRTTIAIAHRLSTILSADVIFVVERGRIVERGTHQELLAAGGAYSVLYEQQFRGERAETGDDDGVLLASGESGDGSPH